MANVATGLWGSGMIKEMLKLRGRDLESWYTSMDSDRTQSAALFARILREELFALKLEVEEPEGWKHRGTLPGGGPFIAEDRVVALDVSRRALRHQALQRVARRASLEVMDVPTPQITAGRGTSVLVRRSNPGYRRLGSGTAAIRSSPAAPL